MKHATQRTLGVTADLLLGAISAGTNIAMAGEPCEPQWVNTLGQPGFGGPTPGSAGEVTAVTVYNGDLIAGGEFFSSDEVFVGRVARWDDCLGWQSVDFGTGGFIRALAVYKGDLIAGGLITGVGGQEMNGITRWDGTQWHPLASGGQIGVSGEGAAAGVYSLTIYNGDLIAGGFFTTAGGQTVNHIARWDGTQWHPFTAGGETGVAHTTPSVTRVFASTVYNRDLVIGGAFTTAGGQTVNNIARWNGSAWHDFTSGGQIGVSSTVRALTVYQGDLVAGGNLSTAGGQTVNRIARWDGSEWHTFTSGGQTGVIGLPVNALAVDDDDLFAGGSISLAGGQDVNGIARWDGVQWHPLVSGGQVGLSAPAAAKPLP